MEWEYLKLYSDVKATPVDWLWYPYIPYGKITLLQGDPGEGKSTMMMNIIASLSTAGFMPDGTKISLPGRVIYQCSEDDASDTIKPRLEACGADCGQIAFIDEALTSFTLDDEILRQAIQSFKANLLVIDPVQAYLGDETNLTNAKQTRKVMQRLGFWAAAYNCAVVLIGHLNKKEGGKELYRALGSIDLVATARSVLQVNRADGSQTVRYVRQIKNSLAPAGPDFGFEIDRETGFKWLGCLDETGSFEWQNSEPPTNNERIADILAALLSKGPVRSTEVEAYFIEKGIALRSANAAKRDLGVKSFRKNGVWYWSLGGKEEGPNA